MGPGLIGPGAMISDIFPGNESIRHTPPNPRPQARPRRPRDKFPKPCGTKPEKIVSCETLSACQLRPLAPARDGGKTIENGTTNPECRWHSGKRDRAPELIRGSQARGGARPASEGPNQKRDPPKRLLLYCFFSKRALKRLAPPSIPNPFSPPGIKGLVTWEGRSSGYIPATASSAFQSTWPLPSGWRGWTQT